MRLPITEEEMVFETLLLLACVGVGLWILPEVWSWFRRRPVQGGDTNDLTGVFASVLSCVDFVRKPDPELPKGGTGTEPQKARIIHDPRRFAKGDVVRICDPESTRYKRMGEIVSIHPEHPNPIPYCVDLDSGEKQCFQLWQLDLLYSPTRSLTGPEWKRANDTTELNELLKKIQKANPSDVDHKGEEIVCLCCESARIHICDGCRELKKHMIPDWDDFSTQKDAEFVHSTDMIGKYEGFVRVGIPKDCDPGYLDQLERFAMNSFNNYRESRGMKKIHEMTQGDSCLNRAEPEEPVFVLLGRDACAAGAVRQWCAMRVHIGKNKATDKQIVEAYKIADEMDAWHVKREEQKKEQCDRPIEGWTCTRGKGHEGPCAARESSTCP